LGTQQPTRDADPVAEVEQLECREVALGHRVLSDVDLNAGAAIGDLQEIRFAKATDREDAAGSAHSNLHRLELVAGASAVLVDDGADRRLGVEALRVRIDGEPLSGLAGRSGASDRICVTL